MKGSFMDQECPKYQYHVQTWGGFYNKEHKRIHGLTPGDFVFDSPEERDAFIAHRRAVEQKLSACHLMVRLSEGFCCNIRTVLHRVSEYKGVRKYTSYDLGVNYSFRAAAYHMEDKWFPGCNDYPFGGDETIYDGTCADFKIVAEWITGATCGTDDLERLQ